MGVAIPMMAASAGMSAFGAYTQGLAQSNYYKYLAGNARTEAGMVQKEGELQGTLSEDQGAYQSRMQGRKTAEIEGAQRAGSGANVGGGSGSTEDIARDTFNKATLDQMAIKYNADVQRWHAENQAKTQAWNLMNQASGYDTASKESKRAGTIGAISSLLGGGGQVASYWLKSKQFGSPTS